MYEFKIVVLCLFQIICDRLTNADASLKEEIANYLEEQFYVPVLRSEDNSIQPVVGQPFSHSSPLVNVSCNVHYTWLQVFIKTRLDIY